MVRFSSHEAELETASPRRPQLLARKPVTLELCPRRAEPYLQTCSSPGQVPLPPRQSTQAQERSPRATRALLPAAWLRDARLRDACSLCLCS